MKLLYSYADAAALLGLKSVQSLRDLVYRKQGPTRTIVGRRVLFAFGDLALWAESHREIIAHVNDDLPPKRRGRPSVRDRQQAGAK
jgi:hypothetical protein